ncbi:N-6 DNA methylase [Streptomyces sp. NPDC051940]|uniref:N-6 DNA methylase n=1 Tax=Streptomyces sp. NPDC051940 TaxID=3155675 RepID=UPI003434C496
MQTDIRTLLLTSGLGLSEEDLESVTGSQTSRIAIRTCRVAVFVTDDLRPNSAKRVAEQCLDDYIAKKSQESKQRHVGILTDGTEWHLYHRINSRLASIDTARLLVNPASPNPEELLSWLEAVIASRQRIKPTPREIERKLGAGSPAYALDSAELGEIYENCRNLPSVKVKRDMWAKLLTTASGTNFTDDDALFVDHSLLVAMAEVIGHAAVGFRPAAPEVNATMIMSGTLFSRSQIGGVVESDFFDWIVETSAGARFVKDLARRLTRFAWDQVEHDVMKVLYQSIIPEEVRRHLGEYYTPDWLAEEIIARCVTEPLNQRVLDASCGSGTFLFHAVRSFVSAAEHAGWNGAKIIRNIGEHVIGIDVHPVAVALARVTYLLAIGVERLEAKDRPAFSVPVYLGDSLRWGQESTIWSYEGLCVRTVLEHEAFIHDPELDVGTGSGNQLKFPERVVANARNFDRLVTELADKAVNRQRGSKTPSLAALFNRFAIAEEDRPVLDQTFRIMCRLHDEERNHIWGYYVRNLARPVWLARPDNRIDVLVGNPPWLPYRNMTEVQKGSFRAMNTERKLWVGGGLATNQDLSALFVVRCIELYLKPGGTFGYVMPLGCLTRRQYEGFRTGTFPSQAEPVKVAFAQPWDFHKIKPKFFPQSVGAVFGKRLPYTEKAIALNQIPEVWSGRFNTTRASRSEATLRISRGLGEAPPDRLPSKYSERFVQGATVVPRLLFLVEDDDSGPLGAGANRQAVRSRRSALEKKPWRDLPALRGIVERTFIHPLHLGDSVLPFRCLKPAQAVIPWDGSRLLRGDDELLDMYPALADWWRKAETIWLENRSSERLSLADRLDYHRGMSQQLPAANHRVVYGASGLYLASAIVSDPSAVIEHKLYWGPATSLAEARFLTAILNSTSLNMAVRPLQGRGEHNPRDFDKYVFQLPIPLYNHENNEHRKLAILAETAEQVAAAVSLPNRRFEALRQLVRKSLTESGVMADIDAIVKKLLG